VLSTDPQPKGWLEPGQSYLRWPTGSSFYYDGAPVPYNHQNEWAYSVFDTWRHDGQAPAPAINKAVHDIVALYARHLLADGGFPAVEKWDYWWGYGYDGWSAASGLSKHMPAYAGDKVPAWISFRTIDLMSILAASDFIKTLDREKLLDSAQRLVEDGKVYPFAALELIRRGRAPAIDLTALQRYARAGVPSELASNVWAVARLPAASAAAQRR